MRWNSPVPPRVSRLMAWVSPRVKRPLPCVRGTTPTSQLIGRTSSTARPSGRRFSTAMRRRMMSFSTLATARLTCTTRSGSASSARSCADTASLTSAVASMRSFLPAPGSRRRTRRRSRCGPRRARPRRQSTRGRPTWACRPALQLDLHGDELLDLLVRKLSASTMTLSDTCSAPASTMTIASAVPVTTRSMSDSFWSSSSVGFTTSWPSMRPTCTEPMGPPNGMLLMRERRGGAERREHVVRTARSRPTAWSRRRGSRS